MIFLKSLIFIIANLFFGYLFVFTLKAFLFLPQKKKVMFGKKISLTPGFVYRKKKLLIDKLYAILREYIADTKNEDKNTRISKWETKAFKAVYDKLKPISDFKFLPKKISENIRYFLSTIVYEIVKQFFRNFVPYLMNRYHIKKYVDLIDVKLDVETIEGYFNRYIYRYLMMIVLAFHFLIGFGNMIVYLIIK